MTIEREIHARVEAFVAELTVLIRRAALESVTQALGTGAPQRAAPVAPRPKRTRAAASSSGGRRSPKQLASTRDALSAHVAANPGQRMEEIKKALGLTTAQLRRPMTQLLAAGAIRREGEKRASRYFAGEEAAPAKKRAPRRSKSRGRKKA